MTADKITAILARHASHACPRLEATTPLGNLGIDLLDLPIVILDIEDAFHVCIPYEDYQTVDTVGALVACTEARLQASAQAVREIASAPRVRRPWMSTGAEQHR